MTETGKPPRPSQTFGALFPADCFLAAALTVRMESHMLLENLVSCGHWSIPAGADGVDNSSDARPIPRQIPTDSNIRPKQTQDNHVAFLGLGSEVGSDEGGDAERANNDVGRSKIDDAEFSRTETLRLLRKSSVVATVTSRGCHV